MDENVLLYVFCLLACAGGLAMVMLRDAVHSSLALLFVMLNLAATYALMQAHLVAALQVIIYGGAIIILIVYIIMLLDVRSEDAQRHWRTSWMIALPTVLLFGLLFARALFPVSAKAATDPLLTGDIPCVGGGVCEQVCDDGKDTDGDGRTDCKDPDCARHMACYGTVESVGGHLLGPYVLPFEVSSVLLLGGIVGAVLLTQKPRRRREDEDEEEEQA
jgi:NADH-quinone oxidoreductase subunit J